MATDKSQWQRCNMAVALLAAAAPVVVDAATAHCSTDRNEKEKKKKSVDGYWSEIISSRFITSNTGVRKLTTCSLTWPR